MFNGCLVSYLCYMTAKLVFWRISRLNFLQFLNLRLV
jgi:hypothetical protein